MEIKLKIIGFYNLIKFDHSILEWNLVNHPPQWRDLRTFYLFTVMMMPSIIMLLFLHLLKDIWASIGLFHLTCIVSSALYMWVYHLVDSSHSSDSYKHPLLNNDLSVQTKQTQDKDQIQEHYQHQDHQDHQDYHIEHKDDDHLILKIQQNEYITPWYIKVQQSYQPKTQYYIGIILFIFSIGIGLALYYLIAGFIPNVAQKIENYGLLKYRFPLYVFFIYFSSVNPFIEEWFWRVFLVNTYGSKPIDRVVITFFYTLYHFFVLIVFFNIWISVLLCIAIYSGGWMFNVLCKHFGVMVGILGHMAADLLIIFIMSNMLYHWFPMLDIPSNLRNIVE